MAFSTALPCFSGMHDREKWYRLFQEFEEGTDEEMVFIGIGNAIQYALEALSRLDRGLGVEGQIAKGDLTKHRLDRHIEVNGRIGDGRQTDPEEVDERATHHD